MNLGRVQIVLILALALLLIGVWQTTNEVRAVDRSRQGCDRGNQLGVNVYDTESKFIILGKQPQPHETPEQKEARALFFKGYIEHHIDLYNSTRKYAANPKLPPTNAESVRINCAEAFPYPAPVSWFD